MKIYEVVDSQGITLYTYVDRDEAERKANEMIKEFGEDDYFYVYQMELIE